MDAVTNLIEKIKSRWRGDTVTYTEMDMLRIMKLLNKKVDELDQQVNSNDPINHNLLQEFDDLKEKYHILDTAYEWQKRLFSKQQQIIKDLTKRKNELLLENAKLRDALRWHPVEEKPKLETSNCSIDVLLKTDNKYCRAYYNFSACMWVASMAIESYSTWIPYPADKGTDCIPEDGNK